MIRKQGCLLGILFVMLVPLIFYIGLLQYRHFYKVGDITFTFWKTNNGCYIMPYEYWGIKYPKNNYMKAVNRGGVIIYLGRDSTLYIFPTYTYEQGAKRIEINLPTYKYVYFPYINEIEDKSAINNKMLYLKDSGYPYIDIYLRDMYSHIGNTARASRMKDDGSLINMIQQFIIGSMQMTEENAKVLDIKNQ